MLIRPTPLPDELDRGYFGYAMRLNGVSSSKEFDKLLRVWAGCQEKSWREAPRLELICQLAGLSTTDFVLHHTTLPLRRGITSYQPDLLHGCNSSPQMLWSSAMRMARAGAFFCEKCANEDLGFHGRSYWRRAHQIPGLLSCQKHLTPLRFIDDEEAFLSAPSRLIALSKLVETDWGESVRRNPTIARYLEICDGLLERTQPLAVAAVSTVLRARGALLGFQTSGGKIKGKLLSDAVIDLCGREWLALVLPQVADKPTNEPLSTLDGVFYLNTSASSTFAYALAAAVLFESSEDALNALATPESSGLSRSVRKKVEIEACVLIGAYVATRGCHAAIAKQLGLVLSNVAIRLNEMGFPNLIESAGKSTLTALSAFFNDRCSLGESAERGGISPNELLDAIQILGAGITDPLRAMLRPTTGRGTGARRARQLNPEEVQSTPGRKAIKFSNALRPEQRRVQQVSVSP